METMDFDDFRATIPATSEVTYLNTGSSSPSSVDVVESMQAFLERHGYESPAEEADLAPGRVEGWVDRANARQ